MYCRYTTPKTIVTCVVVSFFFIVGLVIVVRFFFIVGLVIVVNKVAEFLKAMQYETFQLFSATDINDEFDKCGELFFLSSPKGQDCEDALMK